MSRPSVQVVACDLSPTCLHRVKTTAEQRQYTGDITAYRRDNGQVRLVVRPGPLRASQFVLDQGDPEYVSRAEDLVTFHSVEEDDERRSYRYRVVGGEPGPEGGWVFLEPIS